MATRKNRLEKSLEYDYKKGCPAGYVKRSSYKTSTGTTVPARCIRSTSPYGESRKNFRTRTLRKANQRLSRAGITPYTANTRKVCPPGKILRKAYVRRYTTGIRKKGYTVRRGNKTYRAYPKSKSTIVKAACIEDRGLKGKGPQQIGPLRKGELLKHGYSYRKPADVRHAALRKAEKEFGALGIYRKLNAVAKLSKRTAPQASRVFKEDRDWIRKTMGPLKAF
jgi:hypothetical protein